MVVKKIFFSLVTHQEFLIFAGVVNSGGGFEGTIFWKVRRIEFRPGKKHTEEKFSPQVKEPGKHV